MNIFRAIPVKHLLTMRSGLDCGKLTDPQANCGRKMYQTENLVKYVFGLPLIHEPGAHFNYNDAAPMIVMSVIDQATNDNFLGYLYTHFLKPLEIDLSPNDVGQARFRPRDMAKMGALVLYRGKWKGQVIVSEQWIKESTQNYMEGVTCGDWRQF